MSLDKKYVWLSPLLSFLLPVVLMILVFARLGVYPFGGKTLLVVDMSNEYIDYYAYLHRALREGEGLTRSWQMGMGLNLMGLLAFYTASPLHLILMLFPLEYLTEGVLVLTLVKFGLCGLAFFFYARRVFPLPGSLLAGFSTGYALMGYTVAYSSNLMWLEGVILLPLVLLGVEGLLEEKGHGMLLWWFAAAFFTSYYIGYMVGGFALLYLLARVLAQGGGWGRLARRLPGFFCCAALAAGMCAFLLLPAFLGLKNGQESLWNGLPPLGLETAVLPQLSRLLPGAFDTLTDYGMPNLFCTTPAVFLAVLFFLHRAIPWREKLWYGILLFFLMLSLGSEFLYLGWHAFEDPTWFPARFSFVISFWVLFLALRCLCEAKQLAPHTVGTGAALTIFFALELGAMQTGNLAPPTLPLAIFLVVACAVLWGMARQRRGTLPACALVLAALLCGEACWNGLQMTQGIDRQFQYRERDSFLAFRSTYEPALQYLNGQDAGIYRTEILSPRNANGAMALGYRSISHYSTTTDQAVNRLLRRMGYNTGTVNELRFAQNTPLANGFLGVAYLLSGKPVPLYTLEAQVEEVGVWKNPLSFPLTFWAEQAPGEPEGPDPFSLQNSLLTGLWQEAEPPYRQVVAEEETLGNAVREQREGYVQYTRLSPSEEAWVEWRIQNPDARPVYAFLPVYNRSFAQATAVTGNGQQRELGYKNNTVLYLGDGQEVTLLLKFSADRIRLENSWFYSLDMEAAGELANAAKENRVEFTGFSDRRVEGVYTAPEAGYLVTTFPYDTGWHIRVNGQKAQTGRFAGVFLAVEVPQGGGRLELVYQAPGLRAGACISGASLLVVVGCWLYRRRKRMHRQ